MSDVNKRSFALRHFVVAVTVAAVSGGHEHTNNIFSVAGTVA